MAATMNRSSHGLLLFTVHVDVIECAHIDVHATRTQSVPGGGEDSAKSPLLLNGKRDFSNVSTGSLIKTKQNETSGMSSSADAVRWPE